MYKYLWQIILSRRIISKIWYHRESSRLDKAIVRIYFSANLPYTLSPINAWLPMATFLCEHYVVRISHKQPLVITQYKHDAIGYLSIYGILCIRCAIDLTYWCSTQRGQSSDLEIAVIAAVLLTRQGVLLYWTLRRILSNIQYRHCSAVCIILFMSHNFTIKTYVFFFHHYAVSHSYGVFANQVLNSLIFYSAEYKNRWIFLLL